MSKLHAYEEPAALAAFGLERLRVIYLDPTSLRKCEQSLKNIKLSPDQAQVLLQQWFTKT